MAALTRQWKRSRDAGRVREKRRMGTRLGPADSGRGKEKGRARAQDARNSGCPRASQKKGLVATHTCNSAQLRPAWPCVWHIALPFVADSFARQSLRNRASHTSGCCSGQRCCLELRSFARWLRRESTSLAKTSNCERRTMIAEETESFPWPGLVPASPVEAPAAYYQLAQDMRLQMLLSSRVPFGRGTIRPNRK